MCHQNPGAQFGHTGVSVYTTTCILHAGYGAMLMTTEDGDLGLVIIKQSKLILWSRETACLESGKKDNTRWVRSRVIMLGALLPVSTILYSARLVGIADGIAVILVHIAGRLFTIDVKARCVKEIGKGLYLDGYHVVPFLSFCTPGTN
jgi:hypothetical protein